jgi:hypothetical protein
MVDMVAVGNDVQPAALFGDANFRARHQAIHSPKHARTRAGRRVALWQQFPETLLNP